MSGFLEQIEKRQDQMQENVKQAQGVTEPARGKTVGVKVPDTLYARLRTVKEKFGIRSMKAAVLYATEKGVERLLDSK